jgi:3-oxoacid CoA-transferase subunit A
MKEWYITGDTHGNFSRFYDDYGENDAILILGDAGLNFFLDARDEYLKNYIEQNTKATFYCIRGNHEERPENIPTMSIIYDHEVDNFVYMEPLHPQFKYLQDGQIYNIASHKTLIIGGAYSVDKYYRLEANNNKIKGSGWFPQEQLSFEERTQILKQNKNKKVDFIFTHTCPICFEPNDLFLDNIDQSSVDKAMEYWLKDIKENVNWNIWAFGHYHKDRLERPRVEQYYTDIELISNLWARWNEGKNDIEAWVDKSPNYYKND